VAVIVDPALDFLAKINPKRALFLTPSSTQSRLQRRGGLRQTDGSAELLV